MRIKSNNVRITLEQEGQGLVTGKEERESQLPQHLTRWVPSPRQTQGVGVTGTLILKPWSSPLLETIRFPFYALRVAFLLPSWLTGKKKPLILTIYS